MSAKAGDKGYVGSVPNVRAARAVQQREATKTTATVNQRKAGSVGTRLGVAVRKVVK